MLVLSLLEDASVPMSRSLIYDLLKQLN
jgi:hypothetical protein